MPALRCHFKAQQYFSAQEMWENIARVRNCPEVTLFISLFVRDESHGLGLYMGVGHGVGHGVNHVVGHGVRQLIDWSLRDKKNYGLKCSEESTNWSEDQCHDHHCDHQ